MSEPTENIIVIPPQDGAPNLETSAPEPQVNPHKLPLQILGVCIASIVALWLGGIFLVLAGIFTFVDAWVAGIYKKKDSASFINISPMGWAIAMDGLLIVSFPLYLIFRNKLRTRKGNIVLFILAILFAVLTFVVVGMRILLAMAKAKGGI